MRPINKNRAEAVAGGLNKYQGSPCRHGHEGVRYVSTHACVECAAAAKERKQEAA